MSTENKPREFILADSYISVTLKDGTMQSFRVACSKVDGAVITGDYIHVIEYSAYEQLKAENEKLYASRKEFSRNDWRTFGALALENEQLKADLRTSDLNRQSLWADSVKMADELNYLKAKTDTEIHQLKSKLEVAKKAMQREIKWRTVKYCTEDGLDNLGQALKEIDG